MTILVLSLLLSLCFDWENISINTTLKRVFPRLSKHLEFRQKYPAVFSPTFLVFEYPDETLSLMYDALLKLVPLKIFQTKFGCSLYLTSEFLMIITRVLLRTCRYNCNTIWPPHRVRVYLWIVWPCCLCLHLQVNGKILVRSRQFF